MEGVMRGTGMVIKCLERGPWREMGVQCVGGGRGESLGLARGLGWWILEVNGGDPRCDSFQRVIQRMKMLPPVARQDFQWRQGYIRLPTKPSSQICPTLRMLKDGAKT
jgi:hypothetical protein